MDSFDVMTFIVKYKWWFAPLVPVVIAFVVLKILSPR